MHGKAKQETNKKTHRRKKTIGRQFAAIVWLPETNFRELHMFSWT